MGTTRARGAIASLVGAVVSLSLAATPAAGAGASGTRTPQRTTQQHAYAVDLVATAASGVDMNDRGDVVGTSRPDPGCGSACLPPQDTVVWREGRRIVLPEVSGLSPAVAAGISADGWVAGFVGLTGTTTHAVVWKPAGDAYQAVDLGTLPGKPISFATGIDDRNRVVGWSTTSSFPPSGAPFLWTQAKGMVDLSARGFPAEQPLATSPGGTVTTIDSWYRLRDPGSVTPLPPPPDGFALAGETPAINDAGDQARFLVRPSHQHLRYLFRLHHGAGGTWEQISNTPTGDLSRGVIGSIDDAQNVTATVASTGVLADGPDGLAEPLAPLVSPSYGGGDVTFAGQMNASGQILASMLLGRSGRVVRLVPVEPCATDCVRVTRLTMTGSSPPSCDSGTARVSAALKVTDEAGGALAGVKVTGHFLDDYWLDEVVSRTTDSRGRLLLRHVGPNCVGAIALVVTDVRAAGRTLDRTTGTLTSFVIP